MALAPDEVPTLFVETLEPPEPSVIEVEAEMILEVVPEGQGVGLKLGQAEAEEQEPEVQPKLEVRPPAEPEMQEPVPPPPAAPPAAEDDAKKKKRRPRLETTSRALREAERQRVLEAV